MTAKAPDQETEKKGETFTSALATRMDEIAPLLPNYISKDRFAAAAHAAIKQNPDLLLCTQRSLFNALTKAAQDGLLPDGREGFINSYKTKFTVNGRDEWHPVASWSPMLYGIRKRARELDGIIIDAQVVCKNDKFERDQGDDPKIVHVPAPLDVEPGAMIGSYAIFKREDKTVIHREVLRASEVKTIREQSKASDSLMWTKFEGEGWKKAAVRRGSKTVPVSEKLRALIEREDELFEFNQDHSTPALAPPPAPPPVPKLENKPAIILDAQSEKKLEPVLAGKKQEEPRNISAADNSVGADAAYKDWLSDSYAELDGCQTEAAVEDLRDRVLSEIKPGDVQPWKEACADRCTTLFAHTL